MGGIWEILAGGGVVFEPSGGVKRFDLQGEERGGDIFFWPPSAAFFSFFSKNYVSSYIFS